MRRNHSEHTWDRLCSCGKTFRCSGQLRCATCRRRNGGGERELPKQDPPGHSERIEAHRLRVEEEAPRPWKGDA